MQKMAKNCGLLRENGNDIAVFDTHSLGLYTGRDPYAYNFSKDELRKHMERLIDTFNEHLERVWAGEITKDNLEERIERDDRKIKWDSYLKDRLLRLREKQTYKEEKVYPAFYRPFAPMWVYFDGVFNGSISRLPSIFPTPDAENLAIVISGRGADWFDAFITDRIVDYGFMYNTQIFPLYIYTETFQKQYNISDNTLRLFREKLDDSTITKEDIFFYVFGLLSTPSYVERFRNNLSKQLLRVPILRSFKKISRLGRQLAGVQLIYQQYVWAVVMKEEKMGFVEYTIVEDDELLLLLAGFYPILISQAFMWWNVITKDEAAKRDFPILIANGSNLIEYVEKVKLDKENGELLINEKIKVINIPKFALEFKVGNCSPIEWVSRYLVRQENKETGIVWDPRLRVEKFIDIVRKLISFSWMCIKIKDDLNNLYFMSDKSIEEEMILNEVFNLDLYEFVDEYTDKGSGKASEQMPDCYLRSKKEGLPDLAIEVKTLERDLDRTADFEMPNIPKYILSVRNFHVVLRLNLIPWKEVHPKKMLKLWKNLRKGLSKYKEEWENELNRLWLEERIKDFLRNYLSEKPQKKESWNKPMIIVRSKGEGDSLTFTITTITPVIGWASEDLAFHVEKIEEYVEESKGKFDNLRKVKSNKSDDSPHWELLLVKGQTRIRERFKSFIEELDKELEKKGYDCLFYVREPDSWFGIYHLIIRMDLGTGTYVGDDWKTQIMRILNKV